MYLAGIDIGTTTICGILYHAGAFRVEAVAVRDNRFVGPDPDGRERCQDPAHIEESVRSIIDEMTSAAAARGDDVGALSLTSQMHGILYLDAAGNALSNYYTWQNQQGLEVFDGETVEARVSRILGQPVFTGYGAVTWLYHKLTGGIPEGAVRICGIADYITMRLVGGAVPVSDITITASLGLLDNISRSINPRVFAIDGLEPEFLPELVGSSQVVGTVNSIPVVLPMADNQTGFLGAIKELERAFLITYGTSSQLSFYGRTFCNYPGFEVRPFPGEGYLYVHSSLGGGNSYQLMAEFFRDSLKLFGCERDRERKGERDRERKGEGDRDREGEGEREKNLYAVMDALDLDFTTTEIVCTPLFRGDRGSDNAAASFNRITAANFTPENMIKALVQGMAGELHQFFAGLPAEVRAERTGIVGSGNGIRKNRHLRRVIELLYGRPLLIAESTEESSLGAVVNAGVGIGLFSDYAQGARQVVKYQE
jgi:sedoheptulokinase